MKENDKWKIFDALIADYRNIENTDTDEGAVIIRKIFDVLIEIVNEERKTDPSFMRNPETYDYDTDMKHNVTRCFLTLYSEAAMFPSQEMLDLINEIDTLFELSEPESIARKNAYYSVLCGLGEGERALKEALAEYEADESSNSIRNLIQVYTDLGRYEEAEELIDQNLPEGMECTEEMLPIFGAALHFYEETGDTDRTEQLLDAMDTFFEPFFEDFPTDFDLSEAEEDMDLFSDAKEGEYEDEDYEDEDIREEGGPEEWDRLYEAADKIFAKEPWLTFTDTDLFAYRYGPSSDDIVFFSIMGQLGQTYGVSIYEGLDGLNKICLVAESDQLQLRPSEILSEIDCLTIYWGDREELNNSERDMIRQLGRKYRGRGRWPYLRSFRSGYWPETADKEECLDAARYLSILDDALSAYYAEEHRTDFDHGMYCEISYDHGERVIRDMPLPLLEWEPNPVLPDEETIAEGKNRRSNGAVWELNWTGSRSYVTDPAYSRAAYPLIVTVVDTQTGMVINADITRPEEDPDETAAYLLWVSVLHNGKPAEVCIRNGVLYRCTKAFLEKMGIKANLVQTLENTDKVLEELEKKMSEGGNYE